ncbi:MAG: N-6 DNA methylase [Phycisphaerae bacterium]|nr:N-6 DNA methylase [Phycisphaerae bacterium]
MAVFPSIKIEGGLLGPDLLDQVLGAELPGQRPADFGVDGKRNLTDEIAATFADARALWGVFQNRLQRLSEEDLATTMTRDAWMIPFLGLLGYAPTFNQRAYEIDGLSFAISHRADEAEKAPPIHIVGYRQELGRVPASGRPRLAPHSLVQEYLNRTENLWGIVTNGRILRLLRDCSYIRRQAYVEFDLQAMLDELRFQDYAALYRLLHRTRLPRTDETARDCLLEKYYEHSIEQGGRVRDRLRDGVEKCILRLANGFLRHPASDELRRRVAPDCADNDRITPEDFYRQLLRLVYRLLFLLVSEDRGLLSTDPLYREHYGVARLRRLLDNRAAFTEHEDLWQSLRVLWRLLNDDTPQQYLNNQPMAAVLGLPVLNGELFAYQSLDEASIANCDLLDGYFYLAKYEPARGAIWQRVNYSALDVEELGSVYESLLEFHPAVRRDTAGRLTFDLVFGSERKSTGSYYTPPELVGELIKSALEPVLADRLKASSKEPEKAILSIRVCDPACGSGHFLLAAARRLGKELARVRTGEDEPAPERVREAIRDVVSHCIYGVDKNPLAVDLCRVALWLEAHTSDKPLTFLDHRVRPGDSLVGIFDLGALVEGIPDEAFKPHEGDDTAVARALARQNKSERSSSLFTLDIGNALSELARRSRDVGAIPDDSPEAIRRKRDLFEHSHADEAWRRLRDACNLWIGGFFQRLRSGQVAITTGALLDYLQGRAVDPRIISAAKVVALREHFFHWPLEFPEVSADGGFDVVVGNPPWGSKVALSQSSASFLATAFGRPSKNMNIFALFIDLSLRNLLKTSGRLGLLVPKNYVKTDSYAEYRRDLITKHSLHKVIDFGQFPNVAQEAIGLIASSAAGRADVIERVAHGVAETMPLLLTENVIRSPQAVISLASTPDIGELCDRLRARSVSLDFECEVLRGMEHGRAGTLAHCPGCGRYFERPGKRRKDASETPCPHCRTTVLLDGEPYSFIYSTPTGPDCRGLLLGSSIDRYTLRQVPLYAKLDVPGVDYKDLHESKPKLLFVRISPTLRGYLDESGLLCLNALNVVRKRATSRLDLRYVLAVLNSEVIRAYVKYEITAGASLTIRFSNAAMKALPMPRLDLTMAKDRAEHDGLVALCDEALKLHGHTETGATPTAGAAASAIDAAIDAAVYRLFGLSDEEISVLRSVAAD